MDEEYFDTLHETDAVDVSADCGCVHTSDPEHLVCPELKALRDGITAADSSELDRLFPAAGEQIAPIHEEMVDALVSSWLDRYEQALVRLSEMEEILSEFRTATAWITTLLFKIAQRTVGHMAFASTNGRWRIEVENNGIDPLMIRFRAHGKLIKWESAIDELIEASLVLLECERSPFPLTVCSSVSRLAVQSRSSTIPLGEYDMCPALWSGRRYNFAEGFDFRFASQRAAMAYEDEPRFRFMLTRNSEFGISDEEAHTSAIEVLRQQFLCFFVDAFVSELAESNTGQAYDYAETKLGGLLSVLIVMGSTLDEKSTMRVPLRQLCGYMTVINYGGEVHVTYTSRKKDAVGRALQRMIPDRAKVIWDQLCLPLNYERPDCIGYVNTDPQPILPLRSGARSSSMGR